MYKILHHFGYIRPNLWGWEFAPILGNGSAGGVKQAVTCTLFVGRMCVKCVQYEARMLNDLAIAHKRPGKTVNISLFHCRPFALTKGKKKCIIFLYYLCCSFVWPCSDSNLIETEFIFVQIAIIKTVCIGLIGDYDLSDSLASAANAMQDRAEVFRGSQLYIVMPTVSIVATDESSDSSAPSYISAKRSCVCRSEHHNGHSMFFLG